MNPCFFGGSACLASSTLFEAGGYLKGLGGDYLFWIRKGKDTLAFGNITGAMVFQGTLLPAIGIILTPWEPRKEVYLCIFITLLSSLWIRTLIHKSNIKVWHLGINGVFYFIYLYFALH